MNLLHLRRRQQHNSVNDKNNNEELPIRRRISARLMMIICKYCKYCTIAILFSGFLYSFVSIGIYLGEVISDLGNYYIHPDWLQKNVRLGKFLGEGVVTVAFEADLIDRDNLPTLWKENNNKKNNGYVIKFTGDQTEREIITQNFICMHSMRIK